MTSYSDNFGPFGDVAWIDASHQGALPKRAVAAAQEAIEWKRSLYPLTNSRLFFEVPLRQRELLGRLIHCPADDIILGNSASYGLHLVANGMRWRPGDEVVVVQGDFPATILPWLGLANRGVTVKTVPSQDGCFSVEDLEQAIGPGTRLFCASWVFSFSGAKLDLEAISQVCRPRGVKVMLNCSQGIGAMPYDVGDGYADALTCVGFKWLCGPYGTGFCWIEPELRESLDYNQAYWLTMQSADDLQGYQDMPVVRDDLKARKYDVFGTANFFNLKPWAEAVGLLLEIGMDKVWAYDQSLVQRLIDGLGRDWFDIISPIDPLQRSSILVVSHRDPAKNQLYYDTLKEQQVFISLRNGRLRFSPHLFNTAEQIDRALAIMNRQL